MPDDTTQISSSRLAAENAYRKRKGLPPLTMEEYAAQLSGKAPAAVATEEPADETRGTQVTAPPQPPAQPAAPPSQQAVSGDGMIPAPPTAPDGKPWNSSKLAAENAYRKRKGMPLIDPATVPGLGEAAATPAAAAPPAAPQQPTAAAPSAPAPAAAGPAAGMVAAPPTAPDGKPWNPSKLAAENAYRKRKGMPLIDAATVPGLAAAAAEKAAPAAPTQQPAAGATRVPTPTTEGQKTPAAAPTTRASDEARKYVGPGAPGTSKAAPAGGVAAIGPINTPVDRMRRRLVWSGVAGFLLAWFVAFFRFFLPRTIFEPPTRFRIGYPSDYGLGVDTKFQQQFRIWVDRTPDRLFVIYARCTHLGCTPDWKSAENKFKCPCHGSGFDSEGINFEGPAPRPLDRAHIELDPQGQIVVDVSRLYKWPKGQPSEFEKDGSFIRV
jgi:cytochrome b6-f complex iron-sulfur subunit